MASGGAFVIAGAQPAPPPARGRVPQAARAAPPEPWNPRSPAKGEQSPAASVPAEGETEPPQAEAPQPPQAPGGHPTAQQRMEVWVSPPGSDDEHEVEDMYEALNMSSEELASAARAHRRDAGEAYVPPLGGLPSAPRRIDFSSLRGNPLFPLGLQQQALTVTTIDRVETLYSTGERQVVERQTQWSAAASSTASGALPNAPQNQPPPQGAPPPGASSAGPLPPRRRP